jgi:hypothetical protein
MSYLTFYEAIKNRLSPNPDFLDLVTTLYDICNNFKFGILAKYLNFKTSGKIALKGGYPVFCLISNE